MRWSEEIENIENRWKVGTTFAHSIPFLECQLYAQYMLSIGSTDQFQRETVQYEARWQEWTALFPTS